MIQTDLGNVREEPYGRPQVECRKWMALRDRRLFLGFTWFVNIKDHRYELWDCHDTNPSLDKFLGFVSLDVPSEHRGCAMCQIAMLKLKELRKNSVEVS